MDHSKIAIDVFNRRANAYQDKFMDTSLYHESFNVFCDNIADDNAEILEIACGPGNITRYLLNRRPGFKILGIDLAPNMLALARVNNPGAEFQLMDCRDIATISKQYDAIMCGFCLPYLTPDEAVKLIKDISQLLKPGGVSYISTMEDDPSRSGYETSSSGDRLYINYHQADRLEKALTDNGLKIIDMRFMDYPTNNSATITDLVIVSCKPEQTS